MNPQDTSNILLSENIIIADADYIDRVAFNLTVNFERMLNRRIRPADLSQWAVCVALDGGLRQGDNHTQVALIHDKASTHMENFRPADYAGELSAKAFRDARLGEFTVNAYAVEELVSKEEMMLDMLQTVLGHAEVKRVMVIPNAEEGESYDLMRTALRDVSDEKRVTLFAMQPMPGGNFRQEILGYSLLNALGISAGEINQ